MSAQRCIAYFFIGPASDRTSERTSRRKEKGRANDRERILVDIVSQEKGRERGRNLIRIHRVELNVEVVGSIELFSVGFLRSTSVVVPHEDLRHSLESNDDVDDDDSDLSDMSVNDQQNQLNK